MGPREQAYRPNGWEYRRVDSTRDAGFRTVRDPKMALETIAPGSTTRPMLTQPASARWISANTATPVSSPSSVNVRNLTSFTTQLDINDDGYDSSEEETALRENGENRGRASDRPQYTKREQITIAWLKLVLNHPWNAVAEDFARFQRRYRDAYGGAQRERTVSGLQSEHYRMMESQWGMRKARKGKETTQQKREFNIARLREVVAAENLGHLILQLEDMFLPRKSR